MLRQEKIKGHRALVLENELLKITVLPDKGADIYEFVHKPSDVNFLLRTPDGLRPPGETTPADFLDNYEGGWQELFPNTDASCNYKGVVIPFHGEVSLLPWEYLIERDDRQETSVRLRVRCQLLPFEMQRLMRLPSGEPVLEIEEVVTNYSDEPAAFVWGHHLVLGGDFLEAGCRLNIPATSLATREELYEPATARLEPAQDERWPRARGRRINEWFDLSCVDGPDAHSHDEVLVTDLTEGMIEVTNPRLQLRFSLAWDREVFPWIVLWQPFGGSDAPPLTGIYGLGIEPWVSSENLARSSVTGQAIKLEGGQSFRTKLSAHVSEL